MSRDEIANWLQTAVEIPESWALGDNSLTIPIGSNGSSIRLGATHIKSLMAGTFPVGTGLSLVPNCGIESNGYAEYLIDVDGWGSWPTDKPLRFKLGNVQVQAGGLSPLLALVCESIYRSRDYFQSEFADSYASLRVEGSKTPRADASVALYYLNADYLPPVKSAAGIRHLIDPRDPDIPLESGTPEKLVRHRVRTRDRIAEVEPIILFNQAAMERGAARFLGFYRVLEFFSMRGTMTEYSRMRRDPSVPDEVLLASSRLDKELPQLQALARTVLTPAQARSLVSYVSRHKLATAKSSGEVVKAMYGFRNSLVHAKESEITRTWIPDPFTIERARGSWAWVAEWLAGRSIRRLAARSGA